MSEVLITIGITCYREGELLRECWESVLAQTDDRWAAVLVMDGGADKNTREVFRELEHPRLRKFAFPGHSGHVAGRNKAFELTQTPYHFYLDGDDMVLPDCMATMYRTIEAHADAAYVYGDMFLYPSRQLRISPKTISSPRDVMKLAGAGLYRTDVWSQLGGLFQVAAVGGADSDFLMSIHEAGYPMVCHQRVCYLYRVDRAGRMSDSRPPEAVDVALGIVNRHPVLFPNKKARKNLLTNYFYVTVHANVIRGNRNAGFRYTIKGFRELGILSAEPWGCLGGVILGKTIVANLTPFLERLWFARKRMLSAWCWRDSWKRSSAEGGLNA